MINLMIDSIVVGEKGKELLIIQLNKASMQLKIVNLNIP